MRCAVGVLALLALCHVAHGALYWYPCPNGAISLHWWLVRTPEHAERTDAVVGRLTRDGLTFPGKTLPDRQFFAAHEGIQLSAKTHFSVLIFTKTPGMSLGWVPGQAHVIPAGAVIGGHDSEGLPLYIADVDGYPGYYSPRAARAEYEHYGAKSATTWKLLVAATATLLHSSFYAPANTSSTRAVVEDEAMRALVDGDRNTCVMANQGTDFLHANISFAVEPYIAAEGMTFEMHFKLNHGRADLNSSRSFLETLFVAECYDDGAFVGECDVVAIVPEGSSGRARASLYCRFPCPNVYLKFDWAEEPRADKLQVCDIYAPHGSIEPLVGAP